MEKIIVISSIPGRLRGGAKFTGATEFAPDHFSAAQLTEIINDPVLSVCVGRVLKAEDIHGFFGGQKKAGAAK